MYVEAIAIPVLLSPLVNISEGVFEYEKPTPTGESIKRILATVTMKTWINKCKNVGSRKSR